MEDIIEKLKKSGLTGRSGSGFPTGLKWESVKKEKADKKYIICNASEGEPNIFKDGFILEKYPEEVINGIKLALKTIDNSSAYIYIRNDIYQRLKIKLQKIIGNLPITLFPKSGGYIAGEESAVCEEIDGKKPEPRKKPPFVSQSGLFGYPTLVNNVETFYFVSKIAKDEYKKTRFYSISGDVKNPGVFELGEDLPIEKILKQTNNFPEFDFFVKAGGGACGEILLPNELIKPVCGSGGIVIFNRTKTNINFLMESWAEFFHKGNCDKCTPCREGSFRILEMLRSGKVNKKTIDDLLFVLEETSFCSLGKGIPQTFRGVINKLIK